MVGKTVAVTGANGYIASWLVKFLLERDYIVRGAVRDPDNKTKVGHLLELPGASERLTLFKADLVEEGSHDEVFEGVEGVFHTASPVLISSPNDVQKELLDPAVKGTLNVLKSAHKARTVKRVVITSSVAAMTANPAGSSSNLRDLNIIIDESWFSDPDWCKETKSFYSLSKTLAERTALQYAQESGLNIVFLNPAAVVGAFLQETLNATGHMVLSYLNGSMSEIQNLLFGVVNVKDVAEAHIFVYENKAAEGRYLLAADTLHATRVAELMKELCPHCPVPEKYTGEEPRKAATYSSEKIKKLGFVFTPVREGLKDCVESLKERKLIPAS